MTCIQYHDLPAERASVRIHNQQARFMVCVEDTSNGMVIDYIACTRSNTAKAAKWLRKSCDKKHLKYPRFEVVMYPIKKMA